MIDELKPNYIHDIWWKLIKKKRQILVTELTPKYIYDVKLKLIKEKKHIVPQG